MGTILRTLVLLVLGLAMLSVSVHSLITGEFGTRGSVGHGRTSPEGNFDRRTDPANFWLKTVGTFGFGALALLGAISGFKSDWHERRGQRPRR